MWIHPKYSLDIIESVKRRQIMFYYKKRNLSEMICIIIFDNSITYDQFDNSLLNEWRHLYIIPILILNSINEKLSNEKYGNDIDIMYINTELFKNDKILELKSMGNSNIYDARKKIELDHSNIKN